MTKAIRNPDLRKKVKLTIEIHTRALDELENLLTCIPLCGKHKMALPDDWEKKGLSEREQMTMYYECKECEKVYEGWKRGAWRILGRLWDDYYRQYDQMK